MRLFTKLDNYINDKVYKIIVINNTIHISNYLDIKEFSSTKIIITHKQGRTIIIGTNLVINALQDDEIKITGSINNIILGENYGE